MPVKPSFSVEIAHLLYAMDGNPINKDVFVEYKGKKVYFCCKGCPDQFLANPEKYIAQLPQFQQ